MFRILSTVLLFFGLINYSISQSGANVYGGVAIGQSQDNFISQSGQSHSGFLVGLDGRLVGDDMYFLAGVQYATLSLVSEESLSFFSSTNKMKMIKGRIGVGFNLIRFSESFAIRSKLLGSFNFINDFDNARLPAPSTGYASVNDGYLGAVTGLGVDLGIFTFDVEFEYGVMNVFYQKSQTKYNTLSLTGGIKF
ncbi:MAG TPA: hypothetical protein PK147_06310 [Saprospiraceae bacterium]|nr:hypothetical protein [Lewinellaceae bacterium]HPK08896.1 hypothetical protein [Saprospiraceae bacterium]HPQ21444.1 hypothetical protein [Saprospiraceae bacterium]HRX28464.1 hypothetical protein [Saprospiraceae bacterium]